MATIELAPESPSSDKGKPDHIDEFREAHQDIVPPSPDKERSKKMGASEEATSPDEQEPGMGSGA